jgi:hypothetical protein
MSPTESEIQMPDQPTRPTLRGLFSCPAVIAMPRADGNIENDLHIAAMATDFITTMSSHVFSGTIEDGDRDFITRMFNPIDSHLWSSAACFLATMPNHGAWAYGHLCASRHGDAIRADIIGQIPAATSCVQEAIEWISEILTGSRTDGIPFRAHLNSLRRLARRELTSVSQYDTLQTSTPCTNPLEMHYGSERWCLCGHFEGVRYLRGLDLSNLVAEQDRSLRNVYLPSMGTGIMFHKADEPTTRLMMDDHGRWAMISHGRVVSHGFAWTPNKPTIVEALQISGPAIAYDALRRFADARGGWGWIRHMSTSRSYLATPLARRIGLTMSQWRDVFGPNVSLTWTESVRRMCPTLPRGWREADALASARLGLGLTPRPAVRLNDWNWENIAPAVAAIMEHDLTLHLEEPA